MLVKLKITPTQAVKVGAELLTAHSGISCKSIGKVSDKSRNASKFYPLADKSRYQNSDKPFRFSLPSRERLMVAILG
jgi:hypothetical protein